MSVPKWRRSSSKLDAFYEAVKLRQIVVQMIMRSYGMKLDKPKRLVPKSVRQAYPELMRIWDKVDRYQLQVEETKLLQEYDQWIVDKTREDLFGLCFKLVDSIASANEVRCSIAREFETRILLQDQAICAVAGIKQEVQFVEEFFAIDLNKYMEFAEQLEKVRNYLYRWKRSTVNAYRDFLKEQKAQQDTDRKQPEDQEQVKEKAKKAGKTE